MRSPGRRLLILCAAALAVLGVFVSVLKLLRPGLSWSDLAGAAIVVAPVAFGTAVLFVLLSLASPHKPVADFGARRIPPWNFASIMVLFVGLGLFYFVETYPFLIVVWREGAKLSLDTLLKIWGAHGLWMAALCVGLMLMLIVDTVRERAWRRRLARL
jgi:hypothetical protein